MWKAKDSRCFWIKKQIKPFCIHLSKLLQELWTFEGLRVETKLTQKITYDLNYIKDFNIFNTSYIQIFNESHNGRSKTVMLCSINTILTDIKCLEQLQSAIFPFHQFRDYITINSICIDVHLYYLGYKYSYWSSPLCILLKRYARYWKYKL